MSAEDWIEHSVNCFQCSKLVDERDCVSGLGFEGDICPSCQNVISASLDLLESCKTMLRLLEGENLDEKFSGETEILKDAINKAEGRSQ